MRYIAICIRHPDGLGPDALSELQSAVSACSPEWIQTLPPHTVMAYFPVAAAENAKQLTDSIARLRQDRLDFAALRVGRGEGRPIASYTIDGRLADAPLGQFVNDAIRGTVAL